MHNLLHMTDDFIKHLQLTARAEVRFE